MTHLRPEDFRDWSRYATQGHGRTPTPSTPADPDGRSIALASTRPPRPGRGRARRPRRSGISCPSVRTPPCPSTRCRHHGRPRSCVAHPARPARRNARSNPPRARQHDVGSLIVEVPVSEVVEARNRHRAAHRRGVDQPDLDPAVAVRDDTAGRAAHHRRLGLHRRRRAGPRRHGRPRSRAARPGRPAGRNARSSRRGHGSTT